MPMSKEPSLNVLGEPLEVCSLKPRTGFYRNGYCDTCDADRGLHTVCVIVDQEFLTFSKSVGNDLESPRPEFGFYGLKPGDAWCLCATRFLQAYEAGLAPRVKLRSTHRRTLELVSLDILRAQALERN